jgi:hypothetical protein
MIPLDTIRRIPRLFRKSGTGFAFQASLRRLPKLACGRTRRLSTISVFLREPDACPENALL